MSDGFDCFARRQENGYVVRIAGSEYLLSENEWAEFSECIYTRLHNRDSFGLGYKHLIEAVAYNTARKGQSLLAELGLIKPPEGIRRRI